MKISSVYTTKININERAMELPNLSDWLAISFQLGIGQTIVNKEKEKIRQELEAYAKGIFACAIKHPASGVGYASQRN